MVKLKVPRDAFGETLKALGENISIISHGSIVGIAYEAAEELKTQGINARLIDMASIKPLDYDLTLKAAREIKGIVVAEDHFKYGGLYGAISEFLVEKDSIKIMPVAVKTVLENLVALMNYIKNMD